MAPSMRSPLPMAAVERGRPLRVLAVEYDADLRMFYGTILEEDGHEVRIAADGRDG